MKNNIYFIILALFMVMPAAIFAGLSEEELMPYEKAKALPFKMTAKEISEWPLQSVINEVKYSLDIKPSTIRTNPSDNKVRFKIGGYVFEAKPGKRPNPNFKGMADIYVISTGEKPKVVAKKRIKLSDLCPS